MSPSREREASTIEHSADTRGAEPGGLLLDLVKLRLSASGEHESGQFSRGLEELWRCRPEPLKHWLDARLQQAEQARELIRWLRKRNQFIVFDGAETARVEAFFLELFAEIRRLLDLGPEERAVRMCSLDDKVEAFVRSLPPGAELEVPSASYSADLQLEVLGLDAQRLKQPVLDLGCGSPPHLMLFLRHAGLDVVGIDRDGGEGVITADWIEHDFVPESWGSILSHLAFSLHFLHHHLAPGTVAEAHAKKYMELLRSLRPAGTFAYVPGLPFIERLLPKSEYRVSRNTLGETLADGLAPFSRALGETVSYAARVERLRSGG